ncbi:hypothetical protein [Brevibacterium album]|uniref:hypothetical protein n=1 Tax=Brevibacterium album TaxID=417948 RepID=UPI0012EC45C2|nr:hypothetical protein [Brevibacterium album]
MKHLAVLASVAIALSGCSGAQHAAADGYESQPATVIPGTPGEVVGAHSPIAVTAVRAPDPAPSSEHAGSTQTGWDCERNWVGAYCRTAEESEDQARHQQDWADEQAEWNRQGEEEAEAEANAPHTCDGAGAYGDYSPEGYVDC